VVPIVFVSIVLGTAGLGEPAKLGKIGIQTVSFFLVTTAVALTIGLGVGLILEPGKAGVFDTSNAEFNEQGPTPIMETVINIIAYNTIKLMLSRDMLLIIFFAVFI